MDDQNGTRRALYENSRDVEISLNEDTHVLVVRFKRGDDVETVIEAVTTNVTVQTRYVGGDDYPDALYGDDI